MIEEDLQKLILGCKNKESKSQKHLFLYVYDFGMTIANRYAHTVQEAEEIANDGFYKMLSNIDKYKSNIPFKVWFKKILINCAIDHFRKFNKPDRSIKVTQMVSKNEGVKKLEAAYLDALINKLPPQYRLVFILHVIDGFTHEEIAHKLNITRGTSKSNLSKARKKLQNMVQIHNQKTAGYGL